MKVVEKQLKELRMYENNPRNNDQAVEDVAKSIKEFGFKVPMVIDSNNVIVCGHTRYKACLQLGIDSVPCVVADDLTPDQIKAFRLVENKTNELASWDFEKLDQELNLIQMDMGEFDFDVPDFSDSIIEDDYDEEQTVEPKAKCGDLYQLGVHRLICGDSTDAFVIERLMGEAKADMVFTDPPYGINIVNDNGKVGPCNLAKNHTYSKIIADDTTDTAEASYNILSKICNKIILWGGNYFTKFLPFSDGWIIWDKRVDMTSNNFADGEMGWCSFHTPVRIYHQLWNGMIREGEHENRVHPTQKPVRMLCDVLKDFSNENEIVVDVFGGSGSTLLACEQIKRRCFMCEIDPHYIDVIINRWEKLTGEKAVLIND